MRVGEFAPTLITRKTTTNQPTKKMIAYNITGTGKIAAIVNGKSYTVETDHKNYSEIIQCLANQDVDQFLKLVEIAKEIQKYFDNNNQVEIQNGIIKYNGYVIDNTITRRILKFMKEGLPYEPLLKFFGNLMQNPSHRAVNELYDFLEVGNLPITNDGCFLAFKNVRSDYKDIHSGTFDNSVGSVCKMPRNLVDENKDQTCSTGLHFCSIAYLPHFSDSNGGKTMILKINPKDVVSIPADYNNTKGRCCEYEVVEEYTDNWRERLDRGENGFDCDLYNYCDEDCDDCDCDCDCDCDEDEDECHEDECHEDEKSVNYHNLRDEKGRFIKKNI